MALKNLQSNYDLVPGTGPVENMEIQQGPLQTHNTKI